MGGRTRVAPDLPQPTFERDQVHAARRRDLVEGWLDRLGWPIYEREGYRPRRSGRGNPNRARLLRPGLELDQIGRTGRRTWVADRKKPDRSAWWHIRVQ